MTNEPFVIFMLPCKCGTELEIHGQVFEDSGGRWGSGDIVNCPTCNAEHPLPTKSLRVFYRDGNVWYDAATAKREEREK